MSQGADGRSPSQHRNEEPEDNDDSNPQDRPKTPKPKLRKAKTNYQRPKSRPKRYNLDEDDARESSDPIRRPKSAMTPRFRPAPRASQQCHAPPDPRAYHQGFLSNYSFPPPQAALPAIQARTVMQPTRYFNPDAGPCIYPQQQLNFYGQPIPTVRPYPSRSPGFPTPPMRRGRPTPLERGNLELRKELEIIRLDQEK